MRAYILTQPLRTRLSKPLGKLVKIEEISSTSFLKPFRNQLLISVGDATTEALITTGVIPSLQIVDGKEMRRARTLPKAAHETEIRTINPAGSISVRALKAIKKALGARKPVRLIVDGEEDLLAIPCIMFCPEGSIVLYGQPKKGIVVVRVNGLWKRRAAGILKDMPLRELSLLSKD